MSKTCSCWVGAEAGWGGQQEPQAAKDRKEGERHRGTKTSDQRVPYLLVHLNSCLPHLCLSSAPPCPINLISPSSALFLICKDHVLSPVSVLCQSAGPSPWAGWRGGLEAQVGYLCPDLRGRWMGHLSTGSSLGLQTPPPPWQAAARILPHGVLGAHRPER